MTYRVVLAAGAAAQFHHLPADAATALISRAADLIEAPWDQAHVLPPGDDRSFRETTFGQGRGLLDFHVEDDTEIIRIFNIVWLD